MNLLIFLIIFKEGIIEGLVRDRETKKPIPFAFIIVEEIKKTAYSDENGKYIIKNIPEGSYTIKCGSTGYKTALKFKIFVHSNRITQVNFELEEIVYELKEIEVTAEPFSKSEIESPSSHEFSFSETYYKAGTFSDIQRATQFLPSVTGRDNLNEIVVRGGNPDENLIVIDNFAIPNLSYLPIFGSSGGGVFILDEWMLEDFKFHYGIIPVKYDKISSILEIDMKKGSSEKTQMELEPEIGGFRAHIEGPLFNKNNTFNILAGISDNLWIIRMMEKISPDINKALKEIGIPEKLLLTTTQGKISLNYKKLLIELIGIFGGNHLIIKSLPYKNFSIDLDDKNYTYLFGTNIYKFFNIGYTLLNFGINSTRWSWINRRSDNYNMTLKNHSNIFTYNFRLENKIRKNFFEILSGFEYKLRKFNYIFSSYPDSLFYYEYSQINPDSVIDSTLIEVRKTDINSLNWDYKLSSYTEIKLNLWKITLNTGSRFDYFNSKEKSFGPRFKFSYPLKISSTPLYINFGAGRCYQLPNEIILYLNPENKKLKPYFADIYIGGFNFLFKKNLKISTEFYFKNYKGVPVNKAYITPEPNDFSTIYLSEGKSYTKGMDVYIQKKFIGNLSFSLAYSHSYSYKLDLRNGEWVKNDFDQRNIFGFFLSYKVNYRNFEWFKKMEENKFYKIINWIPVVNFITILFDDEVVYSTSFRYSSGLPHTPKTYLKEFKRWVILEETEINSELLPYFMRIDFRINKINLNSKFFGIPCNSEMYIEFINITNRKNIYDYFYVDKTKEKITL
ncbi:MAG: carboxypeptidase-like regulatory domain-containing protein, partial [candidate division WOR-3 bacterium]